MAESEEELKSLLMRVKKESEKADLKLSIKKLRSWWKVVAERKDAGILGLQRRRIQSGAKDEAWSLRAFV